MPPVLLPERWGRSLKMIKGPGGGWLRIRGLAIFRSEVKTISLGPMKVPSSERRTRSFKSLKRNEVVLSVRAVWRSAILS
jgi:hypothetical protein